MDYIEARLPKKGLKPVDMVGHHNLLKNYVGAKSYLLGDIYIEIYKFEKQDTAISESKKLNVRQTSVVYQYGVSGAYLFIVYSVKIASKSKAMEIVASLAGEE
jgi:hypothetical protein